MPQSYLEISPRLAGQIRLVVTDVDGTIATTYDSLNAVAVAAVRYLEDQSITVGLASGRTLSNLESLARDLGISEPIVAENGGVATFDGVIRHPSRKGQILES